MKKGIAYYLLWWKILRKNYLNITLCLNNESGVVSSVFQCSYKAKLDPLPISQQLSRHGPVYVNQELILRAIKTSCRWNCLYVVVYAMPSKSPHGDYVKKIISLSYNCRG